MPQYNPFIRYDKSVHDKQNELLNYQERYRLQGLPEKEDPTIAQRAKDTGLKVLGYGLQGLDYLFRPVNAVFSGLDSATEYGSEQRAKDFGKGFVEGFKGEKYSGLNDTFHNLIPASRIPIREKPEFWKKGATNIGRKIVGTYDEKGSAFTPEEEAYFKRYFDRSSDDYKQNYGQPDEPGFWNAIGHMAKNATLGDISGLIGEFYALDKGIPKFAKSVKTYRGAELGTGKAYKVKDIAKPHKELDRIYKEIGPEFDAIQKLRNQPTSVKDVVSKMTSSQKVDAKLNVPTWYDDAGKVTGVKWQIPEEGSRQTLRHRQVHPGKSMDEIAQELAKNKGYDLNKVLDDISRKANVDDIRKLGKEEHWKRIVGLTDDTRPTRVKRDIPLVDKVREGGRQITLGGKTIVPEHQISKLANPFKKALAETIPGTSHITQTLGPMLSRSFVKKGVPHQISKVAGIMDNATAEARTKVLNMTKEIGPAFHKLKPDEIRLLTYARDINKNFDFSNVDEVRKLIQQSGVPLDASLVTKKAKDMNLALAKSGQILDDFANTETKMNILKNVQENYVPHVYEMTKEFSRALTEKDKLANAFSRTHKFTTRKGPKTLAEAKEINKRAIAQGLPEPFKIKEDRLDKLIGLRSAAHYKSFSNVQTLNRIKGLSGNVISNRYKDGLVKSDIPHLKDHWVHPELDRILKESVGGYHATYPEFHKFLSALQRIQLPWKTLVTRVVPAFHVRNFMDNTLKLYLDKTNIKGYFGLSAKILKGADGTLTTKNGQQVSYEQIRRWVDEKALRGTGQYGSFGDIPQEIAKVAMETAEGPLKHFLRYLNPVKIGSAIGDTIETHSKLIKFLDEFVKHGDPNWAAQRANRLMFNYGDITPVEREVFRMVYPFYTFHRKNTPLMYDMLISNPEQFLKIQAVKQNIEQKYQIDDDKKHAPEYLNTFYNIRLPGEGSRPETVQYFTPGFSMNSLQLPFQLGKQNIANLSPLFKIPLEMALDTNTFFGGSISDHGERRVQVPSYFNTLPQPIKDQLGIRIGRDPQTKEEIITAPAKFRHIMDSVTGTSIRELGRLFEQQRPQDDQRNMLARAFMKEVDPRQAKYYKLKDEVDRMEARTRALRNEGHPVYTKQDLGVKYWNPFINTRIPD